MSWLNGTGRRDIALKCPCDDGQTAVSADGMWLACLVNGASYGEDSYLEVASLSASGSGFRKRRAFTQAALLL